MYLLAYLAEAEQVGQRPYDFNVEYRLACSGEFYNRRLHHERWRSFEMARLLLQKPFELYVVSRPFNRFPQELCLRFGLNWIREHQAGGASTGSAPPYDDIVEDVCAVVTLLSRRLVIPAFETPVEYRGQAGSMRIDSFRDDAPSPILEVGDFTGWGIRVSRAQRTDHTLNLVEHTPPPLGVDGGALERTFWSLSGGRYASAILQAARAYSSALQLIQSRPELAYQLLISAVEVSANSTYKDYRPSREDEIQRKRSVAEKALSLGLSKEQADELAVEACREEHWATRKFKEFLTRFASDEVWGPDSVFPLVLLGHTKNILL